MKTLLALLLALGAAVAQGQDYAREARWATEVKANLVVGDPVALKLPSGREFLGLWTEAAGTKPAILLVHGVGVHPDHGVIGILRAAPFARNHAAPAAMRSPASGNTAG